MEVAHLGTIPPKTNTTTIIAVNGPRLAETETVITKATDMHWSCKSKDGLGD